MKNTAEEEAVQRTAEQYAKDNRTQLAKMLVDTSVYPREAEPFAAFMAGSPGAGKTEVSKALVGAMESTAPKGSCVLRIDPDEFRVYLPGYQGNNSWLFQSAVSRILERVLDRAFSKSISFLLDGTLSSLEVARKNVSRALKRGYSVQVQYVYRDPKMAWRFVQDRELTEGRNIPLDVFVKQFFSARENVAALKREFGDQIVVDILIQGDLGSEQKIEIDVTAELIDGLMLEPYDEPMLYEALSHGAEHDDQT